MQNRIAGLSGSIACLLLGANLTLLLVRPAEPRAALGQAAATPDGTAILATVQGSGNEPYFVVYDVVSGSPAARAGFAGIRESRSGRVILGDTIVEVDGKPIRSNEDLAQALEDAGVGARVKMTLERDGEKRSVSVTLVALDQ